MVKGVASKHHILHQEDEIFISNPGTSLQVKRDYVEGLNDSLDLVPIGAWHGNGRKAGWY